MKSKKILRKRKKIDFINRERRVKIKYPYPELIAHSIIKKLIKNSVYESFRNSIDKQINNYCFDFTKKIITNYKNFILLSHEHDDINDNNSLNNWNDIIQPLNPYSDRYISTFVPMDKDDIDDYIIPEKENEILGNAKKNFFDSSAFINKSQNNIKEEKLKCIEKNKNNHNNNHNNNAIKISPTHLKKEKNKILSINDVKTIPDYHPYHEESEVISKAREQYFNNYGKGYYFCRNQTESPPDSFFGKVKGTIANEAKKLTKKPKREFNFDRYTFDPNGKVILLKHIDVNTLLTDFNTNSIIISTKNIKGEKNSKNPKDKKNLKKLNELKEKEENEKKIVIEYNLPKVKIKGKSLDKYTNSSNLEKYIRNHEPKIPAGDNFELINPEVGVKIQNMTGDYSIKNGGMDFKNKFNRFSQKEYEEFLQEINKLTWKNNTLKKNKLLSLNNNNSTNKINNLFNTGNISNLYEFNNTSQNPISFNSNLLNNQLLMDSSNNGPISNINDKNLTHSKSLSTIKLNGNIPYSLKMTIDSIDPLNVNKNKEDMSDCFDSERQILSCRNDNKASNSYANIFRFNNKFNELKNISSNKSRNFKEMNLFNFNIMKSKDKTWGLVDENLTLVKSRSTLKLPFKPNFTQNINKNGIMVKPLQSFRIKYEKKVD